MDLQLYMLATVDRSQLTRAESGVLTTRLAYSILAVHSSNIAGERDIITAGGMPSRYWHSFTLGVQGGVIML